MIALLLSLCIAADPPRGLIKADRRAADALVLFSPLLSGTTYLVDRKGRAVHTWTSAYAPGGLYLLPNGNLLRAGRDPDALRFMAGGTTGIIEEFTWEGDRVWHYRLSDDKRVLHHDIEPLPNGNLLAVGWEVKTADEVRAAGRPDRWIPKNGLWSEFVIEIAPSRPEGGKIVWEWHAWDHLGSTPGRLDLTRNPESDLTSEEIQQMQALGYVDDDAAPEDLRADFLHINAIDYHPGLDQIVLSVPTFGELWVIDHGISTEQARGPAGDLLYRWGNARMYGAATEDDQRLFRHHDGRWIEPGLPGAGNLLVFDNGSGRQASGAPFSQVLELKPPVDGGRYPRARAAWGPEQPTWTWSDPEQFFAPFLSGAQRLSTGHTAITAGPRGRLFQVNPKGEVVWRYDNPFTGDVKNRDGSAPQPLPDDESFQHAVFRAEWIEAGHPGLRGREPSQ